MSDTILGLDLGSSSIGWSLLKVDSSGKPCGIEASGVRLFSQGVDGSLERANETPLNTKRRESRQSRRQNWRRKRRILKTQRILQQADLLPPGGENGDEERHQMMRLLDVTLFHELYPALDRREAHLLPYLLRRDALDHPLPRHGLGRAILHLAMRRGFQSNRKSAPKDDEELGVVKSGIDELSQELERTGSRTLGEYFASRDPEEQRIRQRYLGRKQVEEELEMIWEAQKAHHDDLDDALRQRVFRSVLDQRPLKSQKGLIGFCELEEDQRRAPKAHPLYQRFRFLQKVNDLQIIDLATGILQPLSEDQRRDLITQLESGSLTWAKVKKALGYKAKEVRLNLEETGDKSLIGHVTAERIRKVVGSRWDNWSDEEKHICIEDLLTFEKAAPLIRKGREHWQLEDDEAEEFAQIRLEEGYGSLSLRAIRKLLPKMEEGTAFATARKEIYPSTITGSPLDALPPVSEALGNLRNPAVERTLTELRKVVNAIIRQYGKPQRVHVELARDLKKPRSVRKKIQIRQRQREKQRSAAKEAILAEHMGSSSGRDIEKYLLAEECNWICPFTGTPFGFNDLFGGHPSVDIEHIIPFSRSQDNSFRNKTLCLRRENARKGNRTPFEAYSESSLEEIVDRVSRFEGDYRLSKMRLFQMEELPADFSARDLVDTAYASRSAQEYLGLLYGGVIDGAGKRRIQPSGGQTTARLRRHWGMEGLLGGKGKNRDDHRHHAIDATVVALVNAHTIEQISRAAERAQEDSQSRLLTQIPDPWSGMLQEMRDQLEKMVVSRRVHRRVRGALHQETIYSPEKPLPEGGDPCSRVRKSLSALSAADIPKIIDGKVRKAVENALHASGESDPKKAFAEDDHLPRLPRKNGPDTVVRKVRIKDTGQTLIVGKGDRRRHVKAGNNHHAEIVAVLDPETGEEKKWETHIVTMLEAHQRIEKKLPLVQKDHGNNRRFLFSLCTGDFLQEKNIDTDETYVTRVIGISGSEIERVLHTDARPFPVRSKEGGRLRTKLKKVFAQKIELMPLGEIRRSHD